MTKPDPANSQRKFVQYSSLGFQMIAFMAIFGYLGYKGDQYFGFRTPYLLISGLLLGVIGSMVYIIRTLNRLNS
ncbi:MAG: AtpZ/AtpI family protein [Flavobacteriales bacterium]